MTEDNNIILMGFYLNRVFSRLVSTLDTKLGAARIPINHSQFEVMQLLWNIGRAEVSQQEIADVIGRDKAAISRALSHLEAKGYIERRPVSGSKNGISLTSKGIAVKSDLVNILSEAIGEICEPLTDNESRQLISLLKRIYD